MPLDQLARVLQRMTHVPGGGAEAQRADPAGPGPAPSALCGLVADVGSETPGVRHHHQFSANGPDSEGREVSDDHAGAGHHEDQGDGAGGKGLLSGRDDFVLGDGHGSAQA